MKKPERFMERGKTGGKILVKKVSHPELVEGSAPGGFSASRKADGMEMRSSTGADPSTPPAGSAQDDRY
jgi:hypothetical protein